MKRICDWSAIDWRKSNEAIAAETGAAISTVVKRRTLYGHQSSAPRKTRRDLADLVARLKSPAMRAKSAEVQPLGTAAAKTSPRAGRGVENVHAIDWHLVAPSGQHYRIHNLYEFVRTHADLFEPVDVEWKRQGGKRGTGGEYCNATAGLSNIKRGRAKSWKGWTIAPT